MLRNMLRHRIRETSLSMYTTVHHFIKMTINSYKPVNLLTTNGEAM